MWGFWETKCDKLTVLSDLAFAKVNFLLHGVLAYNRCFSVFYNVL